MIEYEVMYKTSIKTLRIYQESDVQDEEVVGWDCMKEDVGKLIGFDDGSELYTRILGVSDLSIRTEIGAFRRADIVHCCVPKFPNTNYSGVLSKEEHPLVRKYSPREKGTVTRMLNGEDIPAKFITPRIKMLSIERLRAAADAKGVDEDFLMDIALKGVVNPNGKNTPFFWKMFATINEINVDKPADNSSKQLPLFNGMTTAKEQEANKTVMTNLKTIKSCIKGTHSINAEEAEVVSGS